MSSQQIRILPLLTCIGAETLAYRRAFLCVQPDTRFCMPLSIRSWKHAHPLWGHDNTSIWLLTDKCGSCFRVALKAGSKLVRMNLAMGGRYAYYKKKSKTSLPTNMQWINSEWWICGLYDTLEQAARCHYMFFFAGRWPADFSIWHDALHTRKNNFQLWWACMFDHL